MSGGVGPPRDIGITKEEPAESADKNKTSTLTVTAAAVKTALKRPTRGSFFTFRQLNSLTVIVVLSASGLVSIEDLAFATFSILYMYFISKFAFPAPPPSGEEPPIFDKNNKILKLYVFVGVVTGLFFPIAYIFHGISQGDKVGIQGAAPHVFLLASEIFLEGLASAAGFSLPIRVFVPVFYNSRMILAVVEWLRVEFGKAEVVKHGGGLRRVQIGRGLAVANMVYWSFNLFGFLLPLFVPKAFKIYYSHRKVKD